MLLEFGNFCVNADIERTKAYYHEHGKTVIEDCGCINCRNYYHAIEAVSDTVKEFFRSLGIDPQKSPEATFWTMDEQGLAYYSVCYHIVGTLEKSVDIRKPIGNDGFVQIPENYVEIEDGFKVGFTTEIDFPEQDFPQPCIQVDIDIHLPWVPD